MGGSQGQDSAAGSSQRGDQAEEVHARVAGARGPAACADSVKHETKEKEEEADLQEQARDPQKEKPLSSIAFGSADDQGTSGDGQK